MFRKALDDEIVLPLNILMSKRSAEIASHNRYMQQAERNYAIAMDSLSKAKAKHMKLVEQIKQLQPKVAKSLVSETKEIPTEEKKRELEKKNGYFGRIFSSFETSAEQEREKTVKKLERLKQECLASYSEMMLKKNIVIQTMSALDLAEENVKTKYFDLLHLIQS